MRKRLISIFLMSILLTNTIATAYALTWWDAWATTSPYNFIAYKLNPLAWVFAKNLNATEELIKQVGELQEIANWSYAQTKSSLATAGGGYISYLYTVMDGSEWLKHYALARAKAVYVQELGAGATPAEAMQKAVNVVDEMYENKIKELTDYQNVTVEFLVKTLPHYKQSFLPVCDAGKHDYNISISPTRIKVEYGLTSDRICDTI
jgi:hypothetical protein